MNFSYMAFTQDDIVNAVNNALRQAGSKIKAVAVTKASDNLVHLKTQRGATLVAILGSFSPSMMFVRGVHRMVKKFEPYTYLFNGQAGRNLECVAFCGESGTVSYADQSTYRDWLISQLPHVDKSVIDERISREQDCNPRIREALAR